MLSHVRSTIFTQIRARMDRRLAHCRVLRFPLAIPAIFMAILVSSGCETSESDSLYSKTLERVEKLRRHAERFDVEFYSNSLMLGNFVPVEAEDGQTYFDWRPTWREHSYYLEQLVSHVVSTGKLTPPQRASLQYRMDSVEAEIEARAIVYQNSVFQQLELHQKNVMEWIETTEFDTSSKYLGLNGARDKLMASRFGRDLGKDTWAHSWSYDIVGKIFFRTDDHFGRQSRYLDQEVEWALWRRFANQKWLDVTQLSTYIDECDGLLRDPYDNLIYPQRWTFDGRFPAEEYVRIKDDVTRSTSRIASSDQQRAKQQTPSPRPPQFTIKAFLSSDDGAKALISQQKIGLRRSEHQLVQKGDLISLSGVEWTILDIDPENKLVEVKSVASGMTHVITYDR